MADDNALSRRQFIGAVAAVGAVGLSACLRNELATIPFVGGGSHLRQAAAARRVRRAQCLHRHHGP
ncbi:MAG: hypothetical protein ACXWX7_20840 [Candidatus Binatia bacterium]